MKTLLYLKIAACCLISLFTVCSCGNGEKETTGDYRDMSVGAKIELAKKYHQLFGQLAQKNKDHPPQLTDFCTTAMLEPRKWPAPMNLFCIDARFLDNYLPGQTTYYDGVVGLDTFLLFLPIGLKNFHRYGSDSAIKALAAAKDDTHFNILSHSSEALRPHAASAEADWYAGRYAWSGSDQKTSAASFASA